MNSLRKKCVTGKKRCYNELNIKQKERDHYGKYKKNEPDFRENGI